MSGLVERLEEDVVAAFEASWEVWQADPGIPFDRDRSTKPDWLAREQRFADLVIEGALAVKEKDVDETIALFDIDGTILTKTAKDRRTIVRPAFPIVAHALTELFDSPSPIGILTTRPQYHLDQELRGPTYLASVINLIDPSYVLSSKDSQRAITLGMALQDKSQADAMYEELRAQGTDIYAVERWMLGDPMGGLKAFMLEALLKENSRRGLVVVDDHEVLQAFPADAARLTPVFLPIKSATFNLSGCYY